MIIRSFAFEIKFLLFNICKVALFGRISSSGGIEFSKKILINTWRAMKFIIITESNKHKPSPLSAGSEKIDRLRIALCQRLNF